jgi:TonB family protein
MRARLLVPLALLALLTSLALLSTVARAAPDGGERVPGTRLRLGMSEKDLEGAGEFVEFKAASLPGLTARRASTRFFGVASQTTAMIRNNRVVEIRFEGDVSPHSADYVEDQLRRAHLLRECSSLAPGHHVCDWLGDVKIHLEIVNGRMDARVLPATPAPADSATEAAAAARPAVGETHVPPAHAAVDTTHAVPARADTSHAVAPARPSAPISVPAPAPVSAPGIISGAVPPPTAVAVLPETLTISLMSRNSPSDWPRIVSSPALEYPEAARRESVQGIVWVLARVAADGAPEAVQVDRGIKELNAAAVSCIQRSRFAPCQRNGSPCRFWVRVAVRFTLY